MTALLVTVAMFTLAGAAAAAVLRLVTPGTVAGRVAYWYLVGLVTIGSLLYFFGVLRVPVGRATVAAILVAAVIALVFRRIFETAPVRHGVAATILLLLPLVAFVLTAAVFPIRDYDGRVTWLPKARAIAHEGTIDGRFFHGEAGLNLHNHYPLLVPLNAAAVLVMTGRNDVETVRWLYVLVAVAAFLAARDLMLVSQPRSAAWVLAAAAWLPVLRAIEGGALAAYNDVTMLAFTGLAALALYTPEFGAAGVRAAALFIAGLVLTKNEGVVVAVAMLAGAVVVRRLRTRFDWLILGLSLAGAVVLLLVWRQRVPPAYDEQYDVLIRTLPDALDRLPAAVKALAARAFDRQTWGWFWPMTGVAAAIALARSRRRSAIAPLVLMLLVLGVYALTFTVTSWNVDELASVAASRLLLHLVIPACFVVAIAIDSIATAASAPDSRSSHPR